MALNEAAQEAAWLRTMEQAIKQMASLSNSAIPMTMYEDNAACIEQVSTGFIKADRVKHISPQIFGYIQDLTDKPNFSSQNSFSRQHSQYVNQSTPGT